MPQQKTASIFLSYERKDCEKVEMLYKQLQDAGHKPWMDKKDIGPGQIWKTAIPKAIKAADLFIACLSSNSVSKEGVLQREIKTALDKQQEKLDGNIFIIPVRLEDVSLPDALGEYQWVDLFDSNGWPQLRQAIVTAGFPGIHRAPVPTTDRWGIAHETRIRDLIGPSYLLDASYHFLDWNPAFDELVAKPFGFRRGQHAFDFIKKLANCSEVVERSKVVFGPTKDPLVDDEPLELRTEKYGLITFQKIAAQIADECGNSKAWSINLNIMGAENLPLLWKDINARLEREINWSRYAASYDQLLIPFDEYQQLLDRIVDLIGDAKRCVDLGAGTGNGTIRLLERDRNREVWAIESSETMLAYLRAKVDQRALDGTIDSSRLTIIKEDVLRLEELPRNHFDAAVLINVLYAVDNPQACLNQVFRVLKPGGVLALSTSHCDTNVDKLFDRMREDLEQKGKFESLKKNFEVAKLVHKKLNDRIHRDKKADIRMYLDEAGFEVDTWEDKAYVEAVVLIKAIKR